jgi:uncharacterized protein HemY
MMSTTTAPVSLRLAAGPATTTPRGARLGAAMARLWLALGGTKPAPAARSRVEEAAEVRALARQVQRIDPRFAADLYAAADRHECLPEAAPR